MLLWILWGQWFKLLWKKIKPACSYYFTACCCFAFICAFCEISPRWVAVGGSTGSVWHPFTLSSNYTRSFRQAWIVPDPVEIASSNTGEAKLDSCLYTRNTLWAKDSTASQEQDLATLFEYSAKASRIGRGLCHAADINRKTNEFVELWFQLWPSAL